MQTIVAGRHAVVISVGHSAKRINLLLGRPGRQSKSITLIVRQATVDLGPFALHAVEGIVHLDRIHRLGFAPGMPAIGQDVEGIGRTGTPKATTALLTTDHKETTFVLGHRRPSPRIGQRSSILPHIALGVVQLDGAVRLTMSVDVRVTTHHIAKMTIRQPAGHGPLGIHIGHPLPHHAQPTATGAVQSTQRPIFLQRGLGVDPDGRPLRHVQVVVSAGNVQILLVDEAGGITNDDVGREGAEGDPVLAAGIVHLHLRHHAVVAVPPANHPDGPRHADGDVPMAGSVHLLPGGEPIRLGVVEGHLVRHFGAAVLRLEFGLGLSRGNFHPVEGVWVEVRDVVRLTSADEVDSCG
mmetsp:Transcript_7467/g.20778  ORF Transcript_7467/g.20778 Transcript_7467/m.20778 type:complete len:353 (-) Transcript_7467:609-1667(-)